MKRWKDGKKRTEPKLLIDARGKSSVNNRRGGKSDLKNCWSCLSVFRFYLGIRNCIESKNLDKCESEIVFPQ